MFHCSSLSYSIHRAALWILGEYCTSVEDIARVIQEVRMAIGEVGKSFTLTLLIRENQIVL